MQMRRRIETLLALVLLISAGCRAPEASQPQAGTVTLHVADWGGASSDPAMARFQSAVAAEWKRTHPRIAIEAEHVPGTGEYVSKMLTAFVAGTQPDVLALDASSAAVFIDNDTLLNLMPFIHEDKVDLAQYYPNVLSIAQRDDRLYALPADFTPMMLYYNKRLFDAARLPYPKDGWTWDDFRADCLRLTIAPPGSPHPTQYGFQALNWMPGWITWIWQNGGDVLTPDGNRSTGAIDSPSTIEALEFFSNLVIVDRVAPSLSATQAEGADPFQSGQCAMQISGHWNLVGLKASERIRLEDVGVVGLPRRRERVTVIYESGYAVTKRCRHPREAWQYVQFMSGPFVQRKKAELGIGISANREIAEQRRGSSPLEPAFLDNVKYGRMPWGARVEAYAQVEDVGQEMMDAILVGGESVDHAAHAAAQRIDPELAR